MRAVTAASVGMDWSLAAGIAMKLLPPWLRAVMDRDVTDDPEYANARLAR